MKTWVQLVAADSTLYGLLIQGKDEYHNGGEGREEEHQDGRHIPDGMEPDGRDGTEAHARHRRVKTLTVRDELYSNASCGDSTHDG